MNFKQIAILFLILGTTLDEASTRVAVTHPYISEMNDYTRRLVDLKLWVWVDIFIITCAILICSAVEALLDEAKLKRLVWLSPLLMGAVRLAAGIWNLILYVSVILI